MVSNFFKGGDIAGKVWTNIPFNFLIVNKTDLGSKVSVDLKSNSYEVKGIDKIVACISGVIPEVE